MGFLSQFLELSLIEVSLRGEVFPVHFFELVLHILNHLFNLRESLWFYHLLEFLNISLKLLLLF